MLKQGLMLFVGATDSGKSTSLAALIDYRNRHSIAAGEASITSRKERSLP